MKAKYLVAAVLAVVILAAAAAGAYLYLQQKQHPSAPPAAVSVPVPPAPAVPAPPPPSLPVPAPSVAPADCLFPGPPPVPPNGYTATDADMKLGHDAIQNFVLQLEAFQACRNAQADQAPPGTPEDRKRAWIEEGNTAVDEAHALANAFSAQLKAYHSRHK